VGPSRKRFLRRLIGDTTVTMPDAEPVRRSRPAEDRARLMLDAATVAACLGAVRGGAQVLRVHNVALLRAALAVYTRL